MKILDKYRMVRVMVQIQIRVQDIKKIKWGKNNLGEQGRAVRSWDLRQGCCVFFKYIFFEYFPSRYFLYIFVSACVCVFVWVCSCGRGMCVCVHM